MELTPRQKLTLSNLKKMGIVDKQTVIDYCNKKLLLPRYDGRKKESLGGKRQKKSERRTHSKQYFQEIIDYLSKK
jgi:hypothetical protein